MSTQEQQEGGAPRRDVAPDAAGSAVEEQTARFLAANPGAGPCSCAELREHLYEFLDSELDDSERDRLRRHVDDCPECTEAADAESHIRTLLRNACSEQAPQGLRARVVAQLTVLRTTTVTFRA